MLDIFFCDNVSILEWLSNIIPNTREGLNCINVKEVTNLQVGLCGAVTTHLIKVIRAMSGEERP